MKGISWKKQAVTMIALVATVWSTTSAAGEVLRFNSGAERIATGRKTLSRYLTSLGAKAGGPRYYVVQYKTAIRQAQLQQLGSFGIKSLRYVPDDGLLIEATPDTAGRLQTDGFDVQAVVPFQAKWKVSGEFPPASIFSAGRPETVFIRLLDGKRSASIQEQLSKMGAKVEMVHGRSIRGPPGLRRTIRVR
jgi:hypothetical protein